ncbi:MAG: hypothetical protein VYA54_08360 [Bdellovibrionota bacterium]|nr:hypothetical protein [Bdellovibrionota bacterium]
MLRQLFVLLTVLLTVSFAKAEVHFTHFKPTSKFKSDHKAAVSPVIDELWKKIKDEGYKAVNGAIKKIFDQRQQTTIGQYNFPEMNWSANLDSDIQLAVVRTLEPRLDQEGWIVLDRLVLGIGAQAYLTTLRDAGEIEISDRQLRLFAGVFYKREYTYQHFADSYREGLTGDIDKLLKSFQKFQGLNFVSIDENEQVKQEEYLSADIGMSVNSPSIYYLSIEGGATVYFSKLSSVAFQKFFDTNQNNETLRLSHQSVKVTGTSLQLELQLDFLNLLKIKLLGGEYSNSLSKSLVSHYQFESSRLETEPKNSELYKALVKVNKGDSPSKLVALDPFKSGREDSTVSNENLALYALMWGKLWGNLSEEIEMNQGSWQRFFYRYQQERVAFDRSLLDTVFRSSDFSRYKSREVENVLFEFEAPIKQSGGYDLPYDTQVSLRMSKEFAAKSARSEDKKKLRSLIDSFENTDGGVVQGIDESDIRAPFFLDMSANVSTDGVEFFFSLTPVERNSAFLFICSGSLNPGKLSKKVRRCINTFGQRYQKVLNERDQNGKFSVSKFKSFMEHLGQAAENFSAFKMLFGHNNVQLSGRFTGKTESGDMFQTFFKEGDFQGFGVVKDAVIAH